MADPTGARSGPALRLAQAVDAVAYGLAVAVVLVVLSAVVSFPLGYGWVGVKFVLFFAGFLLFGIAALSLRPTPPWKRDDDETETEREETRFEGAVRTALPIRRLALPVDQRLPTAAKLFVGSLLTLVTSFLLEAVFGVAR